MPPDEYQVLGGPFDGGFLTFEPEDPCSSEKPTRLLLEGRWYDVDHERFIFKLSNDQGDLCLTKKSYTK